MVFLQPHSTSPQSFSPWTCIEVEISGPRATVHAWVVTQSDMTSLFLLYNRRDPVAGYIFIQTLVQLEQHGEYYWYVGVGFQR